VANEQRIGEQARPVSLEQHGAVAQPGGTQSAQPAGS
jgi:hypothetical protein